MLEIAIATVLVIIVVGALWVRYMMNITKQTKGINHDS